MISHKRSSLPVSRRHLGMREMTKETPSVPPSGDTTSGNNVSFRGFDESEAPDPSGLLQRRAGGEAQKPAPQRMIRHSSPAQRQADVDLDLVALSRENTEMHRDFIGALGRVPQSINTLAVSAAEAASRIAHPFQESSEPILGCSQRQMGSSSDSGVPEGMARAMGDVAAAIALQAQATQQLDNAMRSLTAAIHTVFSTVQQGSDGAEAGQQVVVTHRALYAEALPRVSGNGPLEMEGAVLSQEDSILAPTTATLTLHLSHHGLLPPMLWWRSLQPGLPGPEIVQGVLVGCLYCQAHTHSSPQTACSH
uniref:uncharacterized protein n=1 Tax=Pristiophorus japonicus TaxID=55135 RepID=UPI00398F32CF